MTVLIIGYMARTVVLTLLLWIMVQLQKLDYFFLGLLGSAALACALDTIPYFGHYLAVPVLYICIWKITRASLMPDAVFTVVVSYALMFLVKILLLTALIGDLRPAADYQDQPEARSAIIGSKSAPPARAAPPATNQLPAIAVPANVPAKSADDWLKDISVKGVTANGNKSMLLISANKKSYTLVMNEQTEVQTATGPCRMRLANLSEAWATVEVNGEAAYLRIH